MYKEVLRICNMFHEDPSEYLSVIISLEEDDDEDDDEEENKATSSSARKVIVEETKSSVVTQTKEVDADTSGENEVPKIEVTKDDQEIKTESNEAGFEPDEAENLEAEDGETGAEANQRDDEDDRGIESEAEDEEREDGTEETAAEDEEDHEDGSEEVIAEDEKEREAESAETEAGDEEERETESAEIEAGDEEERETATVEAVTDEAVSGSSTEETKETISVVKNETTVDSGIIKESAATTSDSETTSAEVESSSSWKALLKQVKGQKPKYQDRYCCAIRNDLVTETVYTYENDEIVVTAVVVSETGDALPDDVKLIVEQLDQDIEVYQKLLEEKLAAESAELGEYVLYDIHFEDGDGAEVEPEDASVSVTISYKDGLNLDSPDSADESEVAVYHFDEQSGEIEVTEVTDNIEIDTGGILQEASFETETFSTFAIVIKNTMSSENRIAMRLSFVDGHGEINSLASGRFAAFIYDGNEGQLWTASNRITIPLIVTDGSSSVQYADHFYGPWDTNRKPLLSGKYNVDIGVAKENYTGEISDSTYVDSSNFVMLKSGSVYQGYVLSAPSQIEIHEDQSPVIDIQLKEFATTVMSKSEITGALGDALNYAVVADTFTIEGHVEGNINVNEMTNGGDIQNTNNVMKKVHSLTVDVQKAVHPAPSEDTTFQLGFYYVENKNQAEGRTRTLLETQSVTIPAGETFGQVQFRIDNNDSRFYQGSFQVFELDQNNNLLWDGDRYGEYTVQYSSDNSADAYNEITSSSGVSYVGSAGGTLTAIAGPISLVTMESRAEAWDSFTNVEVVDQETFQERSAVAVHLSNAYQLSKQLAHAKTGNGISVYDVEFSEMDQDSYTLKDYEAGNVVVLNIIIPSSMENETAQIRTGTMRLQDASDSSRYYRIGNADSWSDLAKSVIWNYITEEGEPYSGHVNNSGLQTGTHLLPAGTLTVGGSSAMAVIADTVIQSNEIHKVTFDEQEDRTVVISCSNTHSGAELETVDVSGKKTWKVPEGKQLPESISVILKRNGVQYDIKSISAADNWNYEWKHLPKYNEDGTSAYTYSIDEEPVDGYTKQIQGYDLVNILTGTTQISGSKTWNVPEGTELPESITVLLKQNGEVYDRKEVRAEDDWKYEWTELPQYSTDGMMQYTYSIDEEPVNGYTKRILGNDLVNTITGTTQVSGSKTWKAPAGTELPESVTVILYQNGKEYGERRTVTASDNWQYEWIGLPLYADNGRTRYSYTIGEAPVEGYATEIEGFNIINTKSDQTDVAGVKIWNAPEGTELPESVTVILNRNGEAYDRKEVHASDNWQYEWKDLPLYSKDGTTEYHYSVTEEPVSGYTSRTQGYDLVNTAVGTTEVSGNKTWNVPEGTELPESIMVILKQNGERYDTREVHASDGWKYEWKNLPKYTPDGKSEYRYSIDEEPVNGYTKRILGNDLVNTITGTTQVSGSKTWKAPAGTELPESVTVILYQNGKEYGERRTVTASDNWQYEWTGLPLYADNGRIRYSYTIGEAPVEGYATEIEGFNIINTKSDQTDVAGIKTWNAPEGTELPESVTVILKRNGVEYERKEVHASDNWRYEWKDLPLYSKDGTEAYIYSIEEEPVEGYVTGKGEGQYDLTNTITGMTRVSGSKTWKAPAGTELPESVTVILNRNGEEYGRKEVHAEDGWSYEWKDLPRYSSDGKTEYTYSIDEVDVPGYIKNIEGTNLINTIAGTTEVSVVKVWDDENNAKGYRPDSLVVQLYRNNTAVGTAVVLTEDHWNYTWESLNRYDERGQLYQYTVDEVEVVPHYEKEISYNGNNTVITNTSTDDRETPSEEETPGEKETPAEEETSGEKETPGEKETSDVEETPSEKETSGEERTPGGGRTSGGGNSGSSGATGGGSDGGDTPFTMILDEIAPLAPMPNNSNTEEELTMILDDEVPLSALAKTGDHSHTTILAALAAISAGLAAYLAARRKKESDEDD